MRTIVVVGIFPTLLLVGCGQRAPQVDEVCPRPSLTETDVPADGNADGVADIADAVMTTRHVLSGGEEPTCDAAAHFAFGPIAEVRQWAYEIPDAVNVLHHLFEGLADPRKNVRCSRLSTRTEPCARVGISLDEVSDDGATELLVNVVNRDLEAGVHAWSIGFVAEGCTIADITVEGTRMAPARLDGPGMVTEGYVQTHTDGATAFTAALPSWLEAVSLLPSDEVWPVARLTLLPESGTGCTSCRITTGTVDGLGVPVETVLASNTASYRPEPVSRHVRACAP